MPDENSSLASCNTVVQKTCFKHIAQDKCSNNRHSCVSPLLSAHQQNGDHVVSGKEEIYTVVKLNVYITQVMELLATCVYVFMEMKFFHIWIEI